ncbi:MAG: NAD(P)/FAD-dependent oxidoreductase [Patescibacteria group bacterium]
MENIYNTVIIGGGAAGLSAAMVLARANRKVLIIDAGKQSNRVTKEAHAVFTRDRTAPAELYAIARQQVLAYPTVSIQDGVVKSIAKTTHFEILLENDEKIFAKAIILAQGVNYTLPNVPGLQELFGTKAWHCPFCEGFEANNKKIFGIVEAKRLDHVKGVLANWTTDSVWATPNQVEALVDIEHGVEVRMKDGSVFTVDQVLAEADLKPRDELADLLGCKRAEDTHLVIDSNGKTSVDGVYAAGDQSSSSGQVNFAVSAGHTAGMGVVTGVSI